MEICELYQKFLECGSVTTDSRKIVPGQLFFAIKGETFDGNAFAPKALEDGAAYAVVNEDWYASCLEKDDRLIPVPDTLVALRHLASWHREHVFVNGKRLTVIGLTGTNGKTTTKELTRAVLASNYNVTATEGNLNNNIGVPLTLLKINRDTELALVEMGASHPGDIKELVDIAHPDFGLITNVGKAHLLGFGSFDGVKATKGELYDYLAENGGLALVNSDNEHLVEMASSRKGLRKMDYNREAFQAEVLPCDAEHPFLRMEICDSAQGSFTISTSLVGAYNADNVLTALAVGKLFGVKMSEAVDAVESYCPQNNRSQMVRTSCNTLIVDAYNANPTSMAAALDNFSLVKSDSKVALLGDMRELGEESVAEHKAIFDKVVAMNLSLVCLVGEEFGKAASATNGVMLFPDSASLASWLKDNPVKDSYVLVKGSRGIKMEQAIPEL